MAAAIDPNYVRARSSLLDALAALGPLRAAVVLVGAQAIYEHTRDHADDYAVAPFTFDADLALIPELLADDPNVIDAMRNAGYGLPDQPGIYRRDDGVQWICWFRRRSAEEPEGERVSTCMAIAPPGRCVVLRGHW